MRGAFAFVPVPGVHWQAPPRGVADLDNPGGVAGNTAVLDTPRVPARTLTHALWSPGAVALFIGLLYLGYLAFLWHHFHGDPLRLVHIGTYFTEHDPNGTRGYDGQFYYYAASDPLGAAGYMDNASFRLQRIFYPFVIFVVAGGQQALIPYAMPLINWLTTVGGSWLLARLLVQWGRSPWFALSYALASGIPVALTFDTAEPLAFALVVLGIWCWQVPRPGRAISAAPGIGSLPASVPQDRRWLLSGALAFTAALLTRELAAPVVAGYGLAALWRRDWRTAGWAAATFAPLVLWSAGLSLAFHYIGVFYVQPLEHIPFLAYWLQLGDPTVRSVGYAAQYVVPTLVFGGLGLWAFRRTWRSPAPLLLALLANVYLLTFLHAGGYQQQVAPSRYALGLALTAVLWAGSTGSRRLLWLTLLFAAGMGAFLFGMVTWDPAYLW